MKDLRHHFQEIRPATTKHHCEKTNFIFKNLVTATHVFVRTDAVKAILQPPYEGPFQVVRREKTYVVKIKYKEKKISMDRL